MKYLASLILALVMSLPVAAETVDFTLPDLEGIERSLSEYRGKWVVVNYWATWCPPCREEMPELDSLHDARKDIDTVVLGVNFERVSTRKLKAFVEEQFISFPVLRSAPRRATELGEVPGLPTTYVVSPEGEVVAWQVGQVTRDMIEGFIDKQIAARAAGKE